MSLYRAYAPPPASLPDLANAYEDGYRTGMLDKLLAFRSVLALTNENPEYVRGYRHGQLDGRNL